jgi:hypothetical protein
MSSLLPTKEKWLCLKRTLSQNYEIMSKAPTNEQFFLDRVKYIFVHVYSQKLFLGQLTFEPGKMFRGNEMKFVTEKLHLCGTQTRSTLPISFLVRVKSISSS